VAFYPFVHPVKKSEMTKGIGIRLNLIFSSTLKLSLAMGCAPNAQMNFMAMKTGI